MQGPAAASPRFALAIALALALLLVPGRARAQDAAASLAGKKILVVGFDALGMEADKVERLEALFRMEIERLAGAASPSRRELGRALAKTPALRACTGEPACLAAIGKKLAVDLVVAGNVAALGESYVVNIKVVDVAAASEIRRIVSDPLRGSPDELIEAVRVAAYRLLAPAELHGAVMVLADLPGATIALDGVAVGATPLPRPVAKLALGPHRLVVTAKGFAKFEEEVVVRFQKTSRVVVRLSPEVTSPARPLLGGPTVITREARPWYGSTWTIVGVGVTAAVVGGVLGYLIAKDDVLDCAATPEACR